MTVSVVDACAATTTVGSVEGSSSDNATEPSGVIANAVTASTTRSNSSGRGACTLSSCWPVRLLSLQMIDHRRDTAGAVAVVDVHHRHAVRARVQHAQERGDAAE